MMMAFAAAALYGIGSFDNVLEPVCVGIRQHRDTNVVPWYR